MWSIISLPLAFSLGTAEAIPLIGGAGCAVLVFFGGLFLIARRKEPAVPAHLIIMPAEQPVRGQVQLVSVKPGSRTVLRRRGRVVDVLISDVDALEEPVHGWVVDRSPEGVVLEIDEEEGAVAEDTVLSVRTPEFPLALPWVKVKVHRCRLVNNRYELTCLYQRMPSFSVRMLFG